MLKGLVGKVKFPLVGGHEGSGIVESVGTDVTAFKKGDHVIPLFLPQCRECRVCKRPGANICSKFLEIVQRGGEGPSPFSCRGERLTGGFSTFSEYCVVDQLQLCKINSKAPLNEVCLMGCAIPTGYGAAVNAAKVQPGSTCAIWGLGALGLATVMGCKIAGASKIIAIDINTDKFSVAKDLGATDVINPKDIPDLTTHLLKITGGGVDYTFEAVGSVATMQQAFESTAIGYGVCVIIGVLPHGVPLPIMPYNFQMGRTIKGTMFGDWKSQDDVPKLIDEYLSGKINIDKFITHTLPLEKINEGFELLRQGKSIRTVLTFPST